MGKKRSIGPRERRGQAESHPLRVAVLKVYEGASGERFSACDIAPVVGENVSNVSYHVRVLAGLGALVEAGTEQARGAVRRFYRLADNWQPAST